MIVHSLNLSFLNISENQIVDSTGKPTGQVAVGKEIKHSYQHESDYVGRIDELESVVASTMAEVREGIPEAEILLFMSQI